VNAGRSLSLWGQTIVKFTRRGGIVRKRLKGKDNDWERNIAITTKTALMGQSYPARNDDEAAGGAKIK